VGDAGRRDRARSRRVEGQATDLEIEAREMIRLREVIFRIYADRTGQPYDKIAADCERNKWLNAEEMLAYGLIDRVLDRLPENHLPRKRDNDRE